VDTGLDKNEAELGVLVLAVALEVLADGDSLLDQHVQVLGNFGSDALRLQDTEYLVTGDDLNLGDSVGITKNNTNLGGQRTLTGELGYLLDDLFRGGLEPARRSPRVWNGRGRYALSI